MTGQASSALMDTHFTFLLLAPGLGRTSDGILTTVRLIELQVFSCYNANIGLECLPLLSINSMQASRLLSIDSIVLTDLTDLLIFRQLFRDQLRGLF